MSENENIHFKKGPIEDLTSSLQINNGDICFALYQTQDDTSQSGTIYLKEDNNIIPILPPSEVEGKILCSQGEGKPVKYSSNIILGRTIVEMDAITNIFTTTVESGDVTMVSASGDSIKLQPHLGSIQNTNSFNVYLPLSNFKRQAYCVWADNTQYVIENNTSIPVAGSPNWPIYVNNEGMVVKCDSILGTEEKPFEEIHNKKIILYGDNGAGYLNVVDGLGLSDHEYGAETQIYAGSLWGASSDFQFNIHNEYTEIYYSLNNEECYIALYPANSGYRSFSNALELKGNICLSSDYSYSYDYPSEAVVNADDPYEGQIYFKLLD